jgi:type II secretory pathway component PulF
MAVASGLRELTPVAMAVVFFAIIAGLGIYVLQQMSTTGNIAILGNISNLLGNWVTTWLPIILLVVAVGVVITVLFKSLGGGR